MKLSHLRLEHFRCYRALDLSLPDSGIRLAGSNASGKTSLLESIQLLSTTRSNRASVERELIHWESNRDFELPPYARVAGTRSSDGDSCTIELTLAVDPSRPSHTRKQIKIDGSPRRAIDAVGVLKTVLFEPEDMELILGSPSVRRRYVDIALSTIDSTYLRTLSHYSKILEQRNSLLKQLRDAGRGARGNRMPELEYWDEELLTRAAYIVARRVQYLDQLGAPLKNAFQSLLEEDHELTVSYVPTAEMANGVVSRIADSHLNDAQRTARQSLESALDDRREEELVRGVTVLGPHRDDIAFSLNGRDLASFGSRGQQRVGVVSLKLAEVESVREVSGELPLLLLDDVLSELDAERRERMLNRIGELGGQVIVTATDARFLDAEVLASLPLYEVRAGEIDLIRTRSA
jgi:DNA replication and repair protein RecF